MWVEISFSKKISNFQFHLVVSTSSFSSVHRLQWLSVLGLCQSLLQFLYSCFRKCAFSARPKAVSNEHSQLRHRFLFLSLFCSSTERRSVCLPVCNCGRWCWRVPRVCVCQTDAHWVACGLPSSKSSASYRLHRYCLQLVPAHHYQRHRNSSE